MAIPLMEDDVEIISKLGNTPGADDGLTTQQVKAKFDEAVVRLKNFLNLVLIPELNTLVDVDALLADILDTTLSQADKAANAKIVGEKIATVLQIANAALPKSGGYMTGVLNMSNQQLTGLPIPVSANDAVTKSYVDTTSIAAVLTADSWVGSEAPFYQKVTVAGLTDKKTALAYPMYSGTCEEMLKMQEACGCVSYAERSANEITFWCLEDKPEVDISLNVEVGV